MNGSFHKTAFSPFTIKKILSKFRVYWAVSLFLKRTTRCGRQLGRDRHCITVRIWSLGGDKHQLFRLHSSTKSLKYREDVLILSFFIFQGNDQVRFELTCYALYPEVKVSLFNLTKRIRVFLC